MTDLHKRCVEYYGEWEQYNKVVEECGELIVAISHQRIGRVDIGKVALEAADVEITLRALRLVIGEDVYDNALAAKLDRLRQRLDAFAPVPPAGPGGKDRPCHLELKLLSSDEPCRDPDCRYPAGLHPNWKGGQR